MFQDLPSFQERYVLSFMYETYLWARTWRRCRAVGWANYLLAWAWAIWVVIGIVAGGIMLALDEWRLHRTKPKTDEVRASADELVARHGRGAFRINGGAMYEARGAREFEDYRFLKEVSGKLVT